MSLKAAVGRDRPHHTKVGARPELSPHDLAVRSGGVARAFVRMRTGPEDDLLYVGPAVASHVGANDRPPGPTGGLRGWTALGQVH